MEGSDSSVCSSDSSVCSSYHIFILIAYGLKYKYFNAVKVSQYISILKIKTYIFLGKQGPVFHQGFLVSNKKNIYLLVKIALNWPIR